MSKEILKLDAIENRIFSIRDKKVMIDHDLADLYGVSTKALNQAVKRNSGRFPADFIFRLDAKEKNELVTICDRFTNLKHSVYLPFAFTENGVSMLSSVLNSETAIQINIKIMRAFTRMRQLAIQSSDLRKVIGNIEKRLDGHDREIQIAFDTLKSLLGPPAPKKLPKEYSPGSKKRMGFAR